MYVLKDLKPFEVQQNLSRVLVALEGSWEGHPTGSFTITKEIMESMVYNFDAKLIDTVCDFEHQTLTGATAPASGWIKQLELFQENEGWYLYAHIDWTEEAREMIQTKKYRYVSPVYIPDTIDRKSGKNIGWTLHSLSLTNVPFLEELGEVIANRDAARSEVKRLKVEIEQLKGELKKAKESLITLTESTIANKVDAAIKSKRIHPDQRDMAIELFTASPEKFEAFLMSSKPMVIVSPNNIFDNANKLNSTREIDPDLIKIAAGLSG